MSRTGQTPLAKGIRSRTLLNWRVLTAAALCIASVPIGLHVAVIASATDAPSSSTATAVVTHAPQHALSPPDRVRIPAIGVNAPLMRLGLESDRSLQVPPNSYTAGWFTGGPQPGQLGPAVIAAHVHWNGVNGAFARLSELKAGDRIAVSRTDGSVSVFSVDSVEKFQKDKFPTSRVYGNLNYAGLRLITCDGFNTHSHRYLANLVVFARLVQ